MKFFYLNDWTEDGAASVAVVGDFAVRIWKTGVRTYKSRFGANRYLQQIAEEKVKFAEPDEIIKPEPGETVKDLEERTVGEMPGHVGYFERIFPKDPKKALESPKTFYKSVCSFPPSDVWYESEKEAKRDSDGFDTVYLGPVEVYDPVEIKRIEAEIASYPG